MNDEEKEKAFEGRWRVKCDYGKINRNSATMSFDEFYDYIKGLCRDFFDTGVLLGEGFRVSNLDNDRGTGCYARDLDKDTTDGGFSEFWDLYDKKVGRPKCEKLWAKLTAKDKAEVLAYIPLYKQAQPQKQYRKNPETFLRNKSWKDELVYFDYGTNKPSPEQQQTKLADILVG